MPEEGSRKGVALFPERSVDAAMDEKADTTGKNLMTISRPLVYNRQNANSLWIDSFFATGLWPHGKWSSRSGIGVSPEKMFGGGGLKKSLR
jgi:hypothetical protein